VTKADMTALLAARPEIAETVSALIADRKIGTSKALQSAGAAERQEAARSLAEEILHSIKGFFQSVFSHAEGPRIVTH
jgi:hypothetical protein